MRVRLLPAMSGAASMAQRVMWGAVLVERELAVADLKHVGVVPVAGGGVLGEAGLAEADPGHAVVAGVDVVGGAPEVGADLRPPLPYGVPAILAEAVDHGAAGGEDGLMHLLVGGAHHGVLFGEIVGGLLGHEVVEAAEVVFEVVDAPGGVGLGVLLFVAVAAFEAGTGFGSGEE